MKLLMVLRDALPPTRVDVAVLFDRELRNQGVLTDYVGSTSSPHRAGNCRGRIYRVPARTHPLAWLAEIVEVWRRLPDYDVLVVRDKPLSVLWLYPLARLRGRPVCYWMSFPIPLGDRIAADLHWRRGRLLRGLSVGLRGWIGEHVERRIGVPRADHVFAQSEAMRERLLSTTAGSERRISAVPMGIDAESLVDDPSARPLIESVDTGRPWVVYVGTLEFARRLDVLLDAMALVRQRHADAGLLMIGGASRRQDERDLEQHAERIGLGSAVRFTGPLPMRRALTLARVATVAVSPIPPGPLFDVSSPTKIVEYLALGLPVVATDIPDQRDLLRRFGGGRCVAFDAQALAEAICELLEDPSAARAGAARAGLAMLAERSYPVLAGQVAKVLRTLADRPTRTAAPPARSSGTP